MSALLNQPASDKIIHYVIDNIFRKSFKLQNVTLIGFPGCGKTGKLKFLTRNIKNTEGYNNKTVFTYLDFELLSENEDKAYREVLSYLVEYFSFILNSESLNKINSVLELKKIDISKLIEVINTITKRQELNITFVLDNFNTVFNSAITGRELCGIASLIQRTCPMNISFIFVVSQELDGSEVETLGKLSEFFIQNIVWGKDLLLDDESGVITIKRYEKEFSSNLSAEFTNSILNTCLKDPGVLKELIFKGLNDPNFQLDFISKKSISEIYNFIGKEYLDTRYLKIIKSLKKGSLDFLLKNTSKPSDFLLKTGIIEKKDNKYTTFTPLLNTFISENTERIKNLFVKNVSTSNNLETKLDNSIKDILSGQELLALNYLLKHKEQIVSRDEIAEVIWGNNWESTYSDWALDKVFSKLRSKLKKAKFLVSIKTIKGKGFILSF